MRNVFHIAILALFILSCSDDPEPISEQKYLFEASVMNKGFDCGDTYLVALTNVSGDQEISDGIYYADNLPDDLKKADLNILLNCRLPKADEGYTCTAMGIAYPHIIVVDSEVVEE